MTKWISDSERPLAYKVVDRPMKGAVEAGGQPQAVCAQLSGENRAILAGCGRNSDPEVVEYYQKNAEMTVDLTRGMYGKL